MIFRWFSPEIYLIRDKVIDEKTRIDFVLEQAAKRGVKIFIIVYREIKAAFYHDSKYVQKKMEGLHPNIRVLRHPKKILFLWSHHEKIVLVDETIGFLGGIDLCYGRYDEQSHVMVEKPGEGTKFPYLDYSNPMTKQYSDVANFKRDALDRKTQFRMGRHDIQCAILGQSVSDLAHHFIQYWNFASKDLNPNESQKNLVHKGISGESPLSVSSLSPSELMKKTKSGASSSLYNRYISQRAQNIKAFVLDDKNGTTRRAKSAKCLCENPEDMNKPEKTYALNLHTLAGLFLFPVCDSLGHFDIFMVPSRKR